MLRRGKEKNPYRRGHAATIQITGHTVDVVETAAHHGPMWVKDFPFKSASKVKAAF